MKKTKDRKTQRYKLVVAYDGTHYWGWQAQTAHKTVQGELERVLWQLTGEKKQRINSSGRTDRGVHAKGQVAHVDLVRPVTLRKLQHGLNSLLDPDIRVLSIERVAQDFHARFNAKEKEYRYFIWNAQIMPPFLRHYRTLVRDPLDIEAMKKAAQKLVGRHDFAAFAANPDTEVNGTVRRLHELKVSKHGREITIIARGDGFLYKMVRSLAGFLIRVGKGELTPQMARTILSSGIRTGEVPTAKPEGLFLWRVYY